MHTTTWEDNRILRALREPGDDRVTEPRDDHLAAGRAATPGPDHAARWAARIAFTMTAALAVWSTVLSLSLPATSVSQHWRLVWVGLDLAMALGAGCTAILLIRGDRRSSLTSMGTATLLAFDAWFDVCTSGSGLDHALAIAEAVLFEVPLALAGIWLALRLIR